MRAGDTLRSCNGVAFPIITAFAAETGSGELDAATLVAAMQTTDLRALFLRTAGEPTEAAAAVELARDGAILSDTQVAERIAAAARESDAGVVAFLQLMLSAVLAKVASASQASPLVLGFARASAPHAAATTPAATPAAGAPFAATSRSPPVADRET